ncbi:Uncharacterised protein [Mycobacteroides abscessus subsp. abscessus]|nr:Uncharacterised protein [Mycobacteroides abscessus subsp. abscessus]
MVHVIVWVVAVALAGVGILVRAADDLRRVAHRFDGLDQILTGDRAVVFDAGTFQRQVHPGVHTRDLVESSFHTGRA